MAEKYICDCDVIHAEVVEQVRCKMASMEDCLLLAELYKMFADGTRVRILYALELHEMCVCDLAALMDMTKSAVSHQLKSLRMAKLVRCRREGRNVYYSLADDHIKQIIDVGYDHIKED